MDDDQIAEIRAFNRFYTRQIGLLNEHIGWSPFSLSEARVLYEISRLGHTTGSELSRTLGLDKAYLSRVLRKFLELEFAVMSPIPGDRRQNSIALTTEGDRTVASLNTDSNVAVGQLLAPLTDAERAELVAMMQRIRVLLGDDTGPRSAVVLRPERIGELGWLVHRQGLLYNQQFGWNAEFEGLIARIYYEYQIAPSDPPKALWVADRGGQVLGSIFITPYAGRPGTAQLRMLYVEPAARGEGIGTMLVAQTIDFARRSGYSRIRLWTQSILTSARRIYAAAGFELVESAPHHSFGKDLMGEYWERDLS